MNKDFGIYIEGFFSVEQIDYFSKIVKNSDSMGLKIEKISLINGAVHISFRPILLEGPNEN